MRAGRAVLFVVLLSAQACAAANGPSAASQSSAVATPTIAIATSAAPVAPPGLRFEPLPFRLRPPVEGKDAFDNEFFETLIDFDHDSRPDVIISWSRTSDQGFATLQALHNDGAGKFSDATASVFGGAALSLTGARNFAVADFDGDGFPDVFVADHGADVAPFLGGQSHLFMG